MKARREDNENNLENVCNILYRKQGVFMIFLVTILGDIHTNK